MFQLIFFSLSVFSTSSPSAHLTDYWARTQSRRHNVWKKNPPKCPCFTLKIDFIYKFFWCFFFLLLMSAHTHDYYSLRLLFFSHWIHKVWYECCLLLVPCALCFSESHYIASHINTFNNGNCWLLCIFLTLVHTISQPNGISRGIESILWGR